MRTLPHFVDRVPLSSSGDGPVSHSFVRKQDYCVHVVSSDEDCLERLLIEIGGRRVAVITDDTVASLHAEQLGEKLRAHGVDLQLTSFPHGETNKSLATASQLFDWLAHSAFTRRDIILAVGGGVVIDAVGWVASVYMRGVPYINVPTSLMAQADAAIGGKVAVDHALGKNLLGAFYAPCAVVSNIAFLKTLHARQLRSGLAEVIKKGVIASPELFHYLETELAGILAGEADLLERVVKEATAIKCELIARDPYEHDLRRPLNFGHSIGHAVETVAGYRGVLHGEAVSLGMASACRIAEKRGLLSPALKSRVIRLLDRAGLPTELTKLPVKVSPDDITRALAQVRKVRDNQLRFVLPIALGETMIEKDISDSEIHSGLSHRREEVRTLSL